MEIRTYVMDYVKGGGKLAFNWLLPLIGYPSEHIGNHMIYDISTSTNKVKMLVVTSNKSGLVSEVVVLEGEK